MEITAIICLMCTIVGCLVGYFGFRRNQNNDIRTENHSHVVPSKQSSGNVNETVGERANAGGNQVLSYSFIRLK